MDWLDAGLLAAGAGMAIVLLTSSSPALWATFRVPAALAFQAAGILVTAWLVISWDARVSGSAVDTTGLSPTETALLALPAGTVLLRAAALSALPLTLALALASTAGLAGAVAVTTRHRGRWSSLGPLATVVWTAPTFLLAILVQEFQALVFGRTGLVLAAGYGDVNAVQVFWVAVVLALRPTAYFFQQAKALLDVDESTGYVRTARAKGLAWSEVVGRHVLPATASPVLGAWLNSFRVMAGALPVVEFLFGYPGLGRVLVISLGLSYGPNVGPVHADIAIAVLVAVALALAGADALATGVGRRLDPRTRQLAGGL